jgi:hemerythrin superfamily protein
MKQERERKSVRERVLEAGLLQAGRELLQHAETIKWLKTVIAHDEAEADFMLAQVREMYPEQDKQTKGRVR